MMAKIYNIVCWGLVSVAVIMALLNDELSFHSTTMLIIICIIRFMGDKREFMAVGAFLACIVIFPSAMFLIGGVGDHIHHTIIVAAGLLHAVPMLRFVVSGHKKVLYSGF